MRFETWIDQKSGIGKRGTTVFASTRERSFYIAISTPLASGSSKVLLPAILWPGGFVSSPPQLPVEIFIGIHRLPRR